MLELRRAESEYKSGLASRPATTSRSSVNRKRFEIEGNERARRLPGRGDQGETQGVRGASDTTWRAQPMLRPDPRTFSFDPLTHSAGEGERVRQSPRSIGTEGRPSNITASTTSPGVAQKHLVQRPQGDASDKASVALLDLILSVEPTGSIASRTFASRSSRSTGNHSFEAVARSFHDDVLVLRSVGDLVPTWEPLWVARSCRAFAGRTTPPLLRHLPPNADPSSLNLRVARRWPSLGYPRSCSADARPELRLMHVRDRASCLQSPAVAAFEAVMRFGQSPFVSSRAAEYPAHSAWIGRRIESPLWRPIRTAEQSRIERRQPRNDLHPLETERRKCNDAGQNMIQACNSPVECNRPRCRLLLL